jgi:hypothetical protein
MNKEEHVSTKIKPDNSNQLKSVTAEEGKRLKYVKIELNEPDRIVPVVVFAFHDALAGDDDGMCDEGIGFNVQPISNAVRVLIRPDVSKEEAKIILKEIIKFIDQDRYDWGLETDRYLERCREAIAKKNRVKTRKKAA